MTIFFKYTLFFEYLMIFYFFIKNIGFFEGVETSLRQCGDVIAGGLFEL
jgi:hypothetical protein